MMGPFLSSLSPTLGARIAEFGHTTPHDLMMFVGSDPNGGRTNALVALFCTRTRTYYGCSPDT
eukprot:5386779-Prymnesium_polylepis.1